MTFETFWSIYPRRLNKAQALKSYNTAIKKGAPHEQLARGAQEFRAYVERNTIANQFVCHASTWINQDRWTNDYASDDYTTEPGHNGKQSQISNAMLAAVKTVQKAAQAMEREDRDLGLPY